MKESLLIVISKMVLLGAFPVIDITLLILEMLKIDSILFHMGVCAFMGFLIPALILLICNSLKINHFSLNPYVTLAFWPSQLILMVLKFTNSFVDRIVVYSISLVLNLFLYGLMGLIPSVILKLLFK